MLVDCAASVPGQAAGLGDGGVLGNVTLDGLVYRDWDVNPAECFRVGIDCTHDCGA